MMTDVKTCKKCGTPLQESGFERTLITRGPNKGTSKVRIFYADCPCTQQGSTLTQTRNGKTIPN